ncbi:hypothetical protein PoB_000115200 [Plakobranchus ocellatus]|uniref:DUF7042 domain-containing protein n=1 Tax=Plakobranchus ocellatus TaxID=259542 RepID=A0AAV3XXT1_9GAST|nr:hypothetical protein PoB_000115200 [Plakobranchus ocellatus]
MAIIYRHLWESALAIITVLAISGGPASVEGYCTLPSDLSGEWVDSVKGGLYFNDTTGYITGYNFANFGLVTLRCWMVNDTVYIFESSEFEYYSLNFTAYFCWNFTQVNTDMFYFYEYGNELPGADNERVQVYLPAFSRVYDVMCANPDIGLGTYRILYRNNTISNSISNCPVELQAHWNYTVANASNVDECANDVNKLDLCTDPTKLDYNTSECSTSIGFSENGTVSCLFHVYDITSDIFYLALYQDGGADDNSTYLITCMIVSFGDSSYLMGTQYPTQCPSTQNDSYVVSPGAYVSFIKTSSVFPWWIIAASVGGFLFLVGLISFIIWFCCCRESDEEKKKRLMDEDEDERFNPDLFSRGDRPPYVAISIMDGRSSGSDGLFMDDEEVTGRPGIDAVDGKQDKEPTDAQKKKEEAQKRRLDKRKRVFVIDKDGQVKKMWKDERESPDSGLEEDEVDGEGKSPDKSTPIDEQEEAEFAKKHGRKSLKSAQEIQEKGDRRASQDKTRGKMAGMVSARRSARLRDSARSGPSKLTKSKCRIICNANSPEDLQGPVCLEFDPDGGVIASDHFIVDGPNKQGTKTFEGVQAEEKGDFFTLLLPGNTELSWGSSHGDFEEVNIQEEVGEAEAAAATAATAAGTTATVAAVAVVSEVEKKKKESKGGKVKKSQDKKVVEKTQKSSEADDDEAKHKVEADISKDDGEDGKGDVKKATTGEEAAGVSATAGVVAAKKAEILRAGDQAKKPEVISKAQCSKLKKGRPDKKDVGKPEADKGKTEVAEHEGDKAAKAVESKTESLAKAGKVEEGEELVKAAAVTGVAAPVAVVAASKVDHKQKESKAELRRQMVEKKQKEKEEKLREKDRLRIDKEERMKKQKEEREARLKREREEKKVAQTKKKYVTEAAVEADGGHNKPEEKVEETRVESESKDESIKSDKVEEVQEKPQQQEEPLEEPERVQEPKEDTDSGRHSAKSSEGSREDPAASSAPPVTAVAPMPLPDGMAMRREQSIMLDLDRTQSQLGEAPLRREKSDMTSPLPGQGEHALDAVTEMIETARSQVEGRGLAEDGEEAVAEEPEIVPPESLPLAAGATAATAVIVHPGLKKDRPKPNQPGATATRDMRSQTTTVPDQKQSRAGKPTQVKQISVSEADSKSKTATVPTTVVTTQDEPDESSSDESEEETIPIKKRPKATGFMFPNEAMAANTFKTTGEIINAKPVKAKRKRRTARKASVDFLPDRTNLAFGLKPAQTKSNAKPGKVVPVIEEKSEPKKGGATLLSVKQLPTLRATPITLKDISKKPPFPTAQQGERNDTLAWGTTKDHSVSPSDRKERSESSSPARPTPSSGRRISEADSHQQLKLMSRLMSQSGFISEADPSPRASTASKRSGRSKADQISRHSDPPAPRGGGLVLEGLDEMDGVMSLTNGSSTPDELKTGREGELVVGRPPTQHNYRRPSREISPKHSQAVSRSHSDSRRGPPPLSHRTQESDETRFVKFKEGVLKQLGDMDQQELNRILYPGIKRYPDTETLRRGTPAYKSLNALQRIHRKKYRQIAPEPSLELPPIMNAYRGPDVAEEDDPRMRNWLEELYSDKKFFDKSLALDTDDEFIHSRTEEGRNYLLNRARFWSTQQPLVRPGTKMGARPQQGHQHTNSDAGGSSPGPVNNFRSRSDERQRDWRH